jgi:hypothetical protein
VDFEINLFTLSSIRPECRDIACTMGYNIIIIIIIIIVVMMIVHSRKKFQLSPIV